LPTTLPEPWLSFLTELDEIAGEPTVLACFGGFAVTQQYGLTRPTSDLDVLEIAPANARHRLLEAGRIGTPLSQKYHVSLDFVTVASVPIDYESRLKPMYQGTFHNLSLMVMDPYDVALSKLSRDNDRDFQDVLFLAKVTPFDLDVFERRYREELKPDLFGNVNLVERTFNRWMEAIREDRSRS
jgi:hypothetical protein